MKRHALQIALVGCALVGVAGVSAVVAAPNDGFPRNASGESYGSELTAPAGQGPMLTLVVATNGKEGYVRSVDLARLTEPDVKSPAQALAWQAAMAGLVRSLPVYLNDGRTRVGEFEVRYPTLSEIDSGQQPNSPSP